MLPILIVTLISSSLIVINQIHSIPMLITKPRIELQSEEEQQQQVSKPLASQYHRAGDVGYQPRDARALTLFRNLINKPRVSPLYLLNGTVCRFVNFQPVCTTLSTTGVLRGPTPAGGAGGGGAGGGGAGGSGGGGGGTGGGGAGGNRGGAAGATGGGGAGTGGGGGGNAAGGGGGGGQRPAAAGVSSGGSSVQFATSASNQILRPVALMDDDPQDLNVEATSNLTEPAPIQLVASSAPTSRPISYVVSRRRPINLLQPFRRPSRPVQMVSTRQTPASTKN